MDDMVSKISNILNNPQAMQQIQALTGALGNNSNEPQEPVVPADATPFQGIDANKLSNLLSQMGGAGNFQEPQQHNTNTNIFGNTDSMTLMMKLAPLMSSLKQDDKSTNLLNALKPFLGNERKKKLEEASKMLQMMRMLPLLKNSGFLGNIL